MVEMPIEQVPVEEGYVDPATSPTMQLPPEYLGQDEETGAAAAPAPVDTAQLEKVLKLLYDAGAWISRDPDIWAVDPERIRIMAEGMMPDIQSVPALATAVRAGGRIAGWAMFGMSFLGRVRSSLARRRAKRQAKQAQQEVADSERFRVDVGGNSAAKRTGASIDPDRGIPGAGSARKSPGFDSDALGDESRYVIP